MTRALGASMAAAGVAMVIYALTLPDFGAAMGLSWLVGLPLLLIGAHLWTEGPR